MRIKKLDRYLLQEVIAPFFGGVIFFLFVFTMFQVLRLSEFFIEHGVSFWVLMKLLGLLLVSFLPIAFPVAFLISVLISFGRFSTDSELVAMKSGGMSLFRLTKPILGFSVVVVALSLGLNLDWVPEAARSFRSNIIKIGNTKIVSSIREGTFTSGFFDLLIYADKVDPKTNKMNGVFLYDERDQEAPLEVFAKEGEVLSVKRESDLESAAVLKLYDGSIHQNRKTNESYSKINFREYLLYLEIQEGEGDRNAKPRMLSYGKLKSDIKNAQASGDRSKELELRSEFWRRYALAFSPFLFVFFGIGFGTARTRNVRAGAFLITFLVILLYWGSQSGFAILVQKGWIPPFLGMQAPNLLIAIMGWYSFRESSW